MWIAAGAAMWACGAQAATYELFTNFDATYDSTLTPPYVGSGRLSYQYDPGVGPLPDGTYDWTSLTGLDLLLTISYGGSTFSWTHNDLLNPVSEVNVEIRGNYFFFSNDNGSGSTHHLGSADFENGNGEVLSTEPYSPTDGPLHGGGVLTPLYSMLPSPTSPPVIQGNYGVIPEPASYGAALGLLCAGGAIARRVRRRRSQAR